MRIDIPFNGDFNLPERIREVISEDFEFLLYGNLPSVKTGRPSADINDKRMFQFLEKNASIYKGLINLPVKATVKEIDIKPYVDLGVVHYTVNSVELAKFLKDKYPEIKLTLGVYAFIEDFPLEEEDLFEDIVIPHYFANRNKFKLKEYLEKYKDKPVIFLNQICRFGCTEYIEHSMFLQREKKGQNFYFLGCSMFLLENPLIGVWFRPEDVPKLAEMGFKKFKIINRKDTTEDILYKVYHYTHFKPTDDLFRLIRPQVRQIEPKMQDVWDKIHAFNTKTKISSQDLPEDWFEKTMNCTLEKCSKTCFYCNEVWEGAGELKAVIFFFISSIVIFSSLVYLQKQGFNNKNFLIVSPILLFANYLWLLGFQVDSSIAKNWLISTSIINTVILLGSFLFLGERLTFYKLVAIIFLAIGFFFIYFDKKALEVIEK